MDARFPMNTTTLEQELFMRATRSSLPPGTFYGSIDIFTDGAAMIAEVGHPATAKTLWSHAKGLAYLSSTKVLILTDASEEVWQSTVDKSLNEDAGRHFRY